MPDIDELRKMLGRLRERYGEKPVPPCPVCGAALKLGSIGGGSYPKFTCPNAGEDLRRGDTAHYDAGTHYHQFGDPDVIALLTRLEKAKDGWRPIETAPKDGSTILLAERTWGGNLVVTPGRWFEDEQGWWEHGSHPTDYADQRIDHPTHWMPLPSPPENANVDQL